MARSRGADWGAVGPCVRGVAASQGPIIGASRRNTCRVLVFSALCLFVPRLAHGGVIDTTWNADAVGNWSDPANWDIDPDFPNNNGDLYNVFIHSGETTLDDAFTINDLTLDGGALVGSGQLDVDGTATWTGGALGGDGATAVINFHGDTILDGAFKEFAAVTVNLHGNSTWVDGNISSIEPPEGGIFNNSGTFDIQGDVLWFWNTTEGPVFNNEPGGIVKRTLGTGLAEIWAAFNNDGEVFVESGTMQLAGGGTSTGTFSIDAGAELHFSDFNEGFATPTTLLDLDSIIDSSGTVRFGNSFGNAMTEISGTIDAAEVVSDPGESGEVRFTPDSFYGGFTPGSFEAVSGTSVFDGSFPTVTDFTVGAGATVDVLQFGVAFILGTLTVEAPGVLNLGDAVDGGDVSFGGFSAQSILGDGVINLGDNGNSSISGCAPLTIAPDITIRGRGTVIGSCGSLSGNGDNQGTISIDAPTGFLTVEHMNNSARIEAVNGASLGYQSDFFGVVVNSGTVEVSGGGGLVAHNVDNRGTIAIEDGTLRMEGDNWTNSDPSGVISGTDATIELRGNFETADVGRIDRVNTELVLGNFGILDNSNATFDLDNSTGAKGTWTVRGGRIVGGIVQMSGGAQLVFPSGGSPGILDGVTLHSSPTLRLNSSMFIANGLTLDNAIIDLSIGGTGAAGITFTELGPRFIDGMGEIILGNSQSTGLNAGTVTATIGPDVVIHGESGLIRDVVLQGSLTADVAGGLVALADSVIDPTGQVEARNGGTVRLTGDWDNNGAIAVQEGSTLWLLGVNETPDLGVITRTGSTTLRYSETLNNTGHVLDLETHTDGDVVLRAATIVGGTITSSGAARLLVDATVIAGSTLQGVSLAAELAFTDGNEGNLVITDGLILKGGIVDVQNTTAAPDVAFSGAAQVIGGTGEIVVRANLAKTIMTSGGGGVTFEENVTVRTSSTAFNSVTVQGAGGYVNRGTFLVEGVDSKVTINNFTNEGGTMQVETGARLTLRESLGETVFVQSGGLFVVDGLLLADDAIEIRGGALIGGGSIVVTNAAAPNSPVKVEDGGAIAPGGGIGILTVDGNVIIGGGGRLSVEIGGAADADLLNVVKGQFQVANGDVVLSSADDYLDVADVGGAINGNEYLIVTYVGNLIGTFDNVTPGFDVIYDTVNKQIRVKPVDQPGDADGDGVPDDDDLCPNTIPGAPVDADGCPPVVAGDFDRDGDVDLDDFMELTPCMSGPDTSVIGDCQEKDLDGDGDVDLADVAQFERCFSGQGELAMPGCEN